MGCVAAKLNGMSLVVRHAMEGAATLVSHFFISLRSAITSATIVGVLSYRYMLC